MITDVPWSLTDDYLLKRPCFHDGAIHGVFLSGSRLLIFIADAEKNSYTICVNGITELNIINFWNGSIVGEAMLLPKEFVQDWLWQKLFAGRIAEPAASNLNSLIKSVDSTFVFVIESAYGANIYTTCNSIAISTDFSFERLNQT